MASFSLTQTLRKKAPLGLFRRFGVMKVAALGEAYELSVVIVGKKRMRTLNRTTRGKDYTTDILSFPLDKTAGEIVINLDACKKKAREFDRTFENYLDFLFIHGLVHLLGFDHGSKMESKERAVRQQFGV